MSKLLTKTQAHNVFHNQRISQHLNGKKLAREEIEKQRTTERIKEITNTTKSIKQLLNEGVPQINWLVPNLIPQSGVNIFGGPSGSFKTFAAMDLARAASTGTKWLNKFEVSRVPVIYVDEENGDIVLPNRFYRLFNGLNQEHSDQLFCCIFNSIKLDSDEGGLILRSLVDAYEPGLVVIDSLVRCMEGEEDKADDVRRIFDNIKRYVLKDRKEVAFVILHHTIKQYRKGNSLASLRGSGDLGAFCDCVYLFTKLERDKETAFSVQVAKNRHIDTSQIPGFNVMVQAPSEEKLQLEFSDFKGSPELTEKLEAAFWNWLGEAERTTCSAKMVVEEVASKIGVGKSSVYNMLNRLVSENRLLKEGRVYALPPTVEDEEVV